MPKATQAKISSFEAKIVDELKTAREIAKRVFQPLDHPSTYSVEECYDYLHSIGVEQADEFEQDLVRCNDYAKEIYDVAKPSPEQTFGVFERIFGEDE